MGLQKYRADFAAETQSNGASPWYAQWMGGPSLALIRNCPTMWGPRTVYIRGDDDTFFSIPAACRVRGVTVRGFVSWDDGNYIFTPCTEAVARLTSVAEVR